MPEMSPVCLFDFLKRKKARRITFGGGPGDAIENAVIIQGAPDPVRGILSEYLYLARKFVRRKIDWNLERQTLLTPGDRAYDKMSIKLSDGTQRTVIFDITEFYRKY